MKITSKIAATFAVLALASTAQAAKIQGEIGFAGNFASTPTQITFSNVSVLYGDGNYSGTVGQTFLAGGEFFGPLQTSPLNQVQNLWSFDYLGKTYSFQTTSAVMSDNGNKYAGTGTASITGFEATAGVWEVTKNIGFTFSAGTKSAVPDGGATIALLGLSFLGLGGVSRFVRRK
jgi:hypothetical protein